MAKYFDIIGNILIVISIVISNIGSAQAGITYGKMIQDPSNSAPANTGFVIALCTVYPISIILLILGLYLKKKYKQSNK